jgi:hypothetical protein
MSIFGNWMERLISLALIFCVDYFSDNLIKLAPYNDFYFATCGTINFATIVLFLFFPFSNLSFDLIRLIFIQMVFQFIGWALYICYVPAGMYNFSIYLIMAVTYLRILFVRPHDRDSLQNPDRMLVWRYFKLRSDSYFELLP